MAAQKKRAERAPKSLYRPEYQVFLGVLRELRVRAGLTQIEMAERLGRSQNYVSAAERGAVRLDGLQLHDWCEVCGVDLVTWATEVASRLNEKKPSRKRT